MSNSNPSFTSIDLFAGIGGFRIAVESNGGKCIGYSEIDKNAISAYLENYPNARKERNYGDITKIESLPEHDLMTAGVPCQSWSIAGKNLGFEDARGKLWNDTLYLLNKSRPKAFLFENVKGLVDPRNREAFQYILSYIRESGYYFQYFLINSSDYGIPQSRERVYIIGFKEKEYLDKFTLPDKIPTLDLEHFLNLECEHIISHVDNPTHFYPANSRSTSLSSNQNGYNDYFLFNDIRNGDTTIHSWDILDTTDKEKEICNTILKNRRKPKYGTRDGNPMSLSDLKELDNSITQGDIDSLINKGILKKYKDKYDFRQSKISTGLFGINRIFLPSSSFFPTLVASDSNDYISTVHIDCNDLLLYRKLLIEDVYRKGKYRKLTKQETLRIQGFPDSFSLPDTRSKWMKLVGNSISVQLVTLLVKSICNTGVFD